MGVDGASRARASIFDSRDRYEDLRELGRGSMRKVFLARDRARDELVARKRVLSGEPAFVAALKREFRTVAGLEHPHLVRHHDLGEDDQGVFFTMELVDGGSILDFCASDDVDVRVARVAVLLDGVLDGLRALHASGVVHRDLKPSHVLVDGGARPKIIDFGLVAAGGDALFAVAGTPAYMAPEQTTGSPPSPRADAYALGALLMEILTGAPPFVGDRDSIFEQKRTTRAPRCRERAPSIPAWLDEIVAGMLARDPRARLSVEDVVARRGRAPARSPTVMVELLGRDEPMAALRSLLSDRPPVRRVALLGPSGIGKTALLDACEREARAAGFAVLRGEGRPTERIAFNALDRAVDALARELAPSNAAGPRTELGVGGDAHIALASLAFPALALTRRAQRERARSMVRFRLFGTTDAAQPRDRVFDSLARLVDLLAVRHAGCLLVVDDLQWADSDSLSLLRELAMRTDARVRVLVAARDDEPSLELEAWWKTLSGVLTVRLEPLGEREMEAIVARTAREQGAAPAPLEIARIARSCAGRPFLAEVAGRALSEGRVDIDPSSLLGRLEPFARGLLGKVLVAEGWLDVPSLARLSAARYSVVEETLRDLARAGLVRLGRSPRGEPIADVHHDRVRVAALAAMPAEEIRAHHDAMAEDLARRRSASDEHRLIRHLVGAGRVPEAAKLARAAAPRAQEQGAFALAAEMLAVALAIPAPDAAELRASRARMLERCGRYAAAADEWATLAAGSSGDARLDHETQHAYALIAANRTAEGIVRLDRALAKAGQPTTEKLAARSILAGARFVLGPIRWPSPSRLTGTSRAASARARRDAKIGLVLCFLEPLTGLRYLLHSRDLFARVGDQESTAHSEYFLAVLAHVGSARRGRVALAQRWARSARERLVGRDAPPEVAGMPLFIAGMDAMRVGHWETARASFTGALEVFANADGTAERMMATSWLTMPDVYEQDLPRVVDRLAWFRRQEAVMGGTILAAHIELIAGYVRFLEGKFDESRSVIQGLADMFTDDRPNTQRAGALLYRHMADIYGERRGVHLAFRAQLRRARRYGLLRSMFAAPFAAMGSMLESQALRRREPGASARRVEALANICERAPPLMAGMGFRARAYAADAAGEPDRARHWLRVAQRRAER